jgi:two-component system, NtrC family, response regulator HydG
MNLMIIENDRAVAFCLKEYLGLAGYDSEVFTNPCEGVRAFRLGGYDAVLTDIKMPELSGLDVLAEIRSQDPAAHVIIMTGYADLENAIAAINAGAYAFFRKPLELDKLKECLQRIEREREQGRDTRDLCDELVKLCMNLEEFRQPIGLPHRL